MAKGKKSKGNHYISKGTHCQDKSFYKKLKREWKEKHPIEYYANLVEEWRKGNNPWITIDNPNKNDTRARKIRVRSNDIWGNWKGKYTMKLSNENGE